MDGRTNTPFKALLNRLQIKLEILYTRIFYIRRGPAHMLSCTLIFTSDKFMLHINTYLLYIFTYVQTIIRGLYSKFVYHVDFK